MGLQSKVIKGCKEAGAIAFKLEGNGMTFRGMPDVIVLCPGGKTLFAEIKEVGDKVRPDQKIRIEQLRELGYTVEVIRSNEDIVSFTIQVRKYCCYKR